MLESLQDFKQEIYLVEMSKTGHRNFLVIMIKEKRGVIYRFDPDGILQSEMNKQDSFDILLKKVSSLSKQDTYKIDFEYKGLVFNRKQTKDWNTHGTCVAISRHYTLLFILNYDSEIQTFEQLDSFIKRLSQYIFTKREDKWHLCAGQIRDLLIMRFLDPDARKLNKLVYFEDVAVDDFFKHLPIFEDKLDVKNRIESFMIGLKKIDVVNDKLYEFLYWLYFMIKSDSEKMGVEYLQLGTSIFSQSIRGKKRNIFSEKFLDILHYESIFNVMNDELIIKIAHHMISKINMQCSFKVEENEQFRRVQKYIDLDFLNLSAVKKNGGEIKLFFNFIYTPVFVLPDYIEEKLDNFLDANKMNFLVLVAVRRLYSYEDPDHILEPIRDNWKDKSKIQNKKRIFLCQIVIPTDTREDKLKKLKEEHEEINYDIIKKNFIVSMMKESLPGLYVANGNLP